MKFGDNSTNHFYLKGGEVFKIGRVVLKVIEINEEIDEQQSDEEARVHESREDTDMSLGDAGGDEI